MNSEVPSFYANLWGGNHTELALCAEVLATSSLDGAIRGRVPFCEARILDAKVAEEFVLNGVDKLHLSPHYQAVMDGKLERLENCAKDTDRYVIPVYRGKHLVATGCVRVRMQEKEFVLHDFGVLPEYQGTAALNTLIGYILSLLPVIEQRCEIENIVFGQYDTNPSFQRIVDMVNKAKSEYTITTEPYTWKGSTGRYYLIPKNLALELFEELGGKAFKIL